jgi:FkbM family methyltransferase
MLSIKILLKEIYHLLKSKNGRRFLWLAFLKGSKKRFQPQKVKFAGFRLQIADSLSFIWQVKEIFVDHAYRFKADSPQPIIYDCGANVGTSVLYFKKLYPQAKIIAFEADQNIAKTLQQNLKDNGCSDVKVVSKAVWTDNQGIDIAIENSDGASIYGTTQKTKVPSIRLKSLLQEEEAIDLIKMDIEGAEVEVIKDCSEELSKVKNIFIEYHSYINHPQALSNILQILEKQGFQYFIQNEQSLVSPLEKTNHTFNNNMTLQVNIFAHKV